MKKIGVALLHVLIWMLSIPASALLDVWLTSKKGIRIPEAVLPVFLLTLLVWALWIFGKSFSYRPFTVGKALTFAGYVGVISLAAIAGLGLAYVAVVMYRGGE